MQAEHKLKKTRQNENISTCGDGGGHQYKHLFREQKSAVWAVEQNIKCRLTITCQNDAHGFQYKDCVL